MWTHRPRVPAALIAVSLAVLAGCGTGAAPDNACDLLTTAEAGDLLGAASGEPVEDTDRSHGTQCTWRAEDDRDLFIAVELDRGTSAIQGFEGDRLEAQADGAGASEPGLGDDAFFDEIGGLNVRSGDRIFSTFTEGSAAGRLSDRSSEQRQRAAVVLILGRLGEPDGDLDVSAEAECARTGRCVSTRYRACDVLTDEEVERITGWPLDDVQGTTTPASYSDQAGLCDYYLRLEVGARSDRRSIDILVEPDRDNAEQAYEEERTDARKYSDFDELPDLGPDAFRSGTTVFVLQKGVLMTVRYDAELPSGIRDDSPEIVETAIALADAARVRLNLTG